MNYEHHSRFPTSCNSPFTAADKFITNCIYYYIFACLNDSQLHILNTTWRCERMIFAIQGNDFYQF